VLPRLIGRVRLLALFVGSVLVPLCASAAPAVDGDPVPGKAVKQGEAFAVMVPASALAVGSSPDDLVARFAGRDWPVFSTPSGAGVLMGVDLDGALGPQDFVVERRGPGGGTVVTRGAVMVEKGVFGIQTLTLPEKQVDLDAETLRRVEAEQSAMLAAMQPATAIVTSFPPLPLRCASLPSSL